MIVPPIDFAAPIQSNIAPSHHSVRFGRSRFLWSLPGVILTAHAPFAGATRARCLLLGASKRVNLTLGFGSRVAMV
jgi:hypothetical protein